MYISKSVLVALGFMLLLGFVFGLIVASNLNMPRQTQALYSSAPAERITLGERSGAVMGTDESWGSGKAFVEVARRVIPSVVSITSEKVVKSRFSLPDFFHPWWGRERERSRDPEERRRQGLGSGVIINSKGYIVTNYHVIKDADEIIVVNDKEKYKAKIIGTDPATDLAVIKIEPKGKPLPAIAFGNSDEIEVGEWVLAIGSPFSIWLQHSVTAGIVSGKGRINVGLGEIVYQDFIQTDAAINPGNSGGALVNLRGELVGINTAIYSNGLSGGNVGIGFAIPVNLVKYVARELIDHGVVKRGWLGVEIGSLDQELAEKLGIDRTEGALVTGLERGPAREAGIKPNDVIIQFGDIPIKDSNHLLHVVGTHKPGEVVRVKVWRDGKIHEFQVKLWERPGDLFIARSEDMPVPELGFEVAELSRRMRREYGITEKRGVVVVEVQEGSQAQKEGLQPGDVILSVNKKSVDSTDSFYSEVEKALEKGLLLLYISREGNKFFVALEFEVD